MRAREHTHTHRIKQLLWFAHHLHHAPSPSPSPPLHHLIQWSLIARLGTRQSHFYPRALQGKLPMLRMFSLKTCTQLAPYLLQVLMTPSETYLPQPVLKNRLPPSPCTFPFLAQHFPTLSRHYSRSAENSTWDMVWSDH